MEKITWLPVKGYEGIYEVNNIGDVRSLTYIPKNRTGVQTGRVLKQQKCHKGYLRVCLVFENKKFNTGAHRLVAFAFIPNIENKPQVNHINGIKTDNRVENLEWCTNKENQLHAVKNNLHNPNYGENHHMSKLTNNEAYEIRNKINNGYSIKELSIAHNISFQSIWKIKNNITYIK